MAKTSITSIGVRKPIFLDKHISSFPLLLNIIKAAKYTEYVCVKVSLAELSEIGLELSERLPDDGKVRRKRLHYGFHYGLIEVSSRQNWVESCAEKENCIGKRPEHWYNDSPDSLPYQFTLGSGLLVMCKGRTGGDIWAYGCKLQVPFTAYAEES